MTDRPTALPPTEGKQLKDEPGLEADLALGNEPSELVEWVAPEWPADCPPIGMYHNISWDDYLKIPAVNQSAIKEGRISMGHMRANLLGLSGDDTRARKFGRTFHKRLLEPVVYRETYQLATPCRHIMGAKTKRPGEFCGNAPKVCDPETGEWYCGIDSHSPSGSEEPELWVSETDAAAIEKMAEAVKRHPISSIMHRAGGHEVTIITEWDGVACKCRLDKLTEKAPGHPVTVVDLKKVQVGKGTTDHIQKAVRDWGYDIQMWFYMRAVKQVTGEWPHGCLIFVEDGEPFDVNPKLISPALWEVGRMKAQEVWDQSVQDPRNQVGYRWCIQAGRYPGYCEVIEELLPAVWEMKRYDLP